MNKKKILIIAAICLVVLIILVKSVKENRVYIHSLERLHQKEIHEWVINQRSIARSLDCEIAEVLSAPDEETISIALSNAYDIAHKGREALWRPSLIKEVNDALDRWRFTTIYDEFGNYLYYLNNKKSKKALTFKEVENLELIRSYVEILYAGFNDIIPFIQYEEETSPGMKTLEYYPWKRITKDRGIIEVISIMGSKLNELHGIGYNDEQFRGGNETRNVSLYEYGLVHSDEEDFDEKALNEKANEFIENIETVSLKNNTKNLMQYKNEKSNYSESSGYGSSSNVDLIGEFIHYTKEYSDINAVYDMDITNKGGHIFMLQLYQKSSSIDSLKDATSLGKELLEYWKNYEDVELELTQSQSSQKDAHFAYSVYKEDVLDKNKIITLYISLGKDQNLGIDIDAFRYFDSYNYSNYKPALTPEEAKSYISPQLTAAGEPRLEVNNSYKLIYSIPVTGIKWVNNIYVDAITGEYLGLEYDYTKP